MGVDPISIGALVLGGLGVGAKVAGDIQAGNARSAASNYQAEVARNNATIADQNADYAIKAGEISAYRQGQRGAANAGKIKAAQAASGVDVNSGSAVDVQAGEAGANREDIDTLRQDALLRAYGYRSQSADFIAESNLDVASASQAKKGALLGATGDLLSGASSTGTKWAAMKG